MEKDGRNDSGLQHQSEEDYRDFEARRMQFSCYQPERSTFSYQLPQPQIQDSPFLDGGISAHWNNGQIFGVHCPQIVAFPHPEQQRGQMQMKDDASRRGHWQAVGIQAQVLATMGSNNAAFNSLQLPDDPRSRVASERMNHGAFGESIREESPFLDLFESFDRYDTTCSRTSPDTRPTMKQTQQYYPNQQHKQPAAGAQAFTVVSGPNKQMSDAAYDQQLSKSVAEYVSDGRGCSDVGEMNRQSRGKGLEWMYSFFSDGSSSESQLSGGNEAFSPSGGIGAVQRQSSVAFQDNSKTDWPGAGNVAAAGYRSDAPDERCVPYAADTTNGFAHPNQDRNHHEFDRETSASSVSLFLDSPPCYNQASEVQLTTPRQMQQFYPGQLKQPAAGAHAFTAIANPQKQMGDQYGKASLKTVVEGVRGGAPYRPPLESMYSFYSDVESGSQYGSKEASLPSPPPGSGEDQRQSLLSGRESFFSLFQDSPKAVGAAQGDERGRDAKEQLEADKDKFKVTLDVNHFKPEELTVTHEGNAVIIEGKHQERPDEHGFVSRQFTLKYVLPKDVNLEAIKCDLSLTGFLTLEAPKLALPAPQVRQIPIGQKEKQKGNKMETEAGK